MYPMISFEINELRRRELRVEAARARLAAEAKRAGRRRSNIDWLGRVASRWQRLRTAPAAPAVMTPTAPARTPGTRQVRGRVRRARETHATTSARG